MAAAGRHIIKYTRGYQQLFPDATIILIQASLSDMFVGDATQKARLQSACEVILRLTSAPDRGSTLLHAFSNGGSTMALQMAIILKQQQQQQNRPLPFDKIVFDCSPSRPDVGQAARAMTVGLPQRYFIRTIARLLVHFLGFLYKVMIELILRREDMITKLRRRLNDSTLFALSVPRLYVYSELDQMVGFRDVHDHADDARANGFQSVEEVVFHKAPHCALPTEDYDRYWNAIKAHVSGEDTKGPGISHTAVA